MPLTVSYKSSSADGPAAASPGSTRPRTPVRPLVVLAMAGALAAPVAPSDAGTPAARSIERAQGAEAWRDRPAIQMDLVLTMGGRRVLDGRLLAETTGGRSRLELNDGTVAVFDGGEARVWPDSSALKGARFHLLTWPYFLALPMKLSDPGTHLDLEASRDFAGTACDVQRLTFDAGTGDSPRDHYLVFSDRATHRVVGAAYAVTYGKSSAQVAADSTLHAIHYDRFVTVDGVTLPTHWMFHDWMPEGKLGATLNGNAELSNLRFVVPAADAFVAPAGSRVDPLPVAGTR